MSLFDLIGQLGLRGNWDGAWFGWPKAPRLEELREAWLLAPDLAAKRAIAREIQMEAWREAPFLPRGRYCSRWYTGATWTAS
jgi:peptide/nickel transport system substrate-binding protein